MSLEATTITIPIHDPEGLKHLCWSREHVSTTGGELYGKSLDQMTEEDASLVYGAVARKCPDPTKQKPTTRQCTLWFMDLTVSSHNGVFSVRHEKLGTVTSERFTGADMRLFCEELTTLALKKITCCHKKEHEHDEGYREVPFSEVAIGQAFHKPGGAKMKYVKKGGSWAEMQSVEHILAGTQVVVFKGSDRVVAYPQ